MRIVGWIHAIGGLTLAALAATAFLWPQLLWGEPNGGDIGASLEREADGSFSLWGDQCVAEAGIWRCKVETDIGSGPSGGYRVVLDSDDCWSAVGSESPRQLSGCINTFDFLGF